MVRSIPSLRPEPPLVPAAEVPVVEGDLVVVQEIGRSSAAGITYVLVKAVTRQCPPIVQYVVVAAASFLGMLGVCWWTPMFFVQLSIVTTPSVRWTALAVIFLASLVFEPLYGRLYRFCKQILLKVWYRFA